MNPFTVIVAYVVLWWISFLAVLPFGVRGQWEDGDIAHGSEPGAPANPMLLKKALAATLIAAVAWLILYGLTETGILTIDSLPGPDSFWD